MGMKISSFWQVSKLLLEQVEFWYEFFFLDFVQQ